jgi:hypothetical protein
VQSVGTISNEKRIQISLTDRCLLIDIGFIVKQHIHNVQVNKITCDLKRPSRELQGDSVKVVIQLFQKL